jgi:glycosyltransferase involved in cell wall biosynthesis
MCKVSANIYNTYTLNFSIIIPTSNRLQHVANLLEQLLAQSYADGIFEIIIVDNSATGNVPSSLKQQTKETTNVRIIHVRKQGPSWARNAGLRISKYDHVIFLDDDVVIERNFLALYKKAWKKHPSATIIGGRILPDVSTLSLSPSYKAYQDSLIQQYGWVFACTPKSKRTRRLQLGDFLYSANISLNKMTVSLQKPLFHQALGSVYFGMPLYAEDFELCCRLLMEHHEIWFDTRVTVHHAFGTNRFSRWYILKRHIMAGPEQFLMDIILYVRARQFLHHTHAYSILLEIKDLVRLRSARLWHRFTNIMTFFFTLSYFLLGPVAAIYAYTRRHTVNLIEYKNK